MPCYNSSTSLFHFYECLNFHKMEYQPLLINLVETKNTRHKNTLIVFFFFFPNFSFSFPSYYLISPLPSPSSLFLLSSFFSSPFYYLKKMITRSFYLQQLVTIRDTMVSHGLQRCEVIAQRWGRAMQLQHPKEITIKKKTLIQNN